MTSGGLCGSENAGVLSVDNSTYSYRNIAHIEYQIDNHKINFVASPSHTSFWNRVKDAFIGDIDE